MFDMHLQKALLTKLGIRVNECTPMEWLELALGAEAKARACGPSDSAYRAFLIMRDNYERAALVAEALQHEI
jgi:hypothetical protein